jgi:hypothetical protein
MWPRYFEILLGLWLVVSPEIYGHAAELQALAASERVTGAAIVIASVLSFWRRTESAHFASGAIALLLAAYGWLSFPRPGPPPVQNDITVAVVVLMFFLLPNRASQPPESWRKHRQVRG